MTQEEYMTPQEYQEYTQGLIEVINNNAKLRAELAQLEIKLAKINYDLELARILEQQAKMFIPHEN